MKLTKEQQHFYDEMYRVYYENFDKEDMECKVDALDMLNSVKNQLERENQKQGEDKEEK